jgi:hypothetical protein
MGADFILVNNQLVGQWSLIGAQRARRAKG